VVPQVPCHTGYIKLRVGAHRPGVSRRDNELCGWVGWNIGYGPCHGWWQWRMEGVQLVCEAYLLWFGVVGHGKGS